MRRLGLDPDSPTLRIGGLALVLAVMVACGADPDGDVLGDVEDITPEELEALRAENSVYEVGDISPAEEAGRREARVAEAEADIEARLVGQPELRDRLLFEVTSPNAVRTDDGNIQYALPGGPTLTLQGEGLQRLSLATSLQRLGEPATQSAMLDALLPIVPDGCRDLVPAQRPSDVDDLAALNASVARCWDDWRTLLAPFRGDETASRQRRGAPDYEGVNPGVCDNVVEVGLGDDGAAACVPSSQSAEIMLSHWQWLGHLPPVRNQVARGTCVAFATASALEYATSRRDGRDVDVSEQQLYAIGKFDLYGENFGDGLPLSSFYQDLDVGDWSIPLEDSWGYNPSWCREVGSIDGQGGYYVDSCLGYDDACSETAHQMDIVSSNGVSYFVRPGPGNEVLEITESVPLFYYFLPYLDFANAYVDAGWGVVAGLLLDEDFMDIGPTGLLVPSDPSDVAYHAVHVVRWIPNPSVAGGGTVVIKNSWGCGWGDSGYAYLTAEWFREHLTDLNAVRPRGVTLNTSPTLTVTSPAPTVTQSLSGLGNAFTLRASVADAEDGPDCCSVSWWSSMEGDLGVGVEREVVFVTAGTREVIATTRDSYGAITETTATTITLTNEGPDVRITRPPVPPTRRGERRRLGYRVPAGVPIRFSGEVSDPNQLAVDCSDQDWSFDIEGQRDPIGCRVLMTLIEGWVRVEYSAEDNGGEIGRDVRWVRAVDWTPLDDPWVQITTPPHDDWFISDPGDEIELTATAVSGLPGRHGEVAWTLIRNGNETSLGTGDTLHWTPSDDVPFSCGGSSAQLRATFTDDNATESDTIDIYVAYPVC